MTAALIVVGVLLAATAVGLLMRRREGRVRRVAAPAGGEHAKTGNLAARAHDAPAVVHFSAPWCGPCAAVRTVVARVVTELADAPVPPRDIEIDISAEPDLAREHRVLSLPTTVILDAAGTERFRITGVPRAADLRTALRSLANRE